MRGLYALVLGAVWWACLAGATPVDVWVAPGWPPSRVNITEPGLRKYFYNVSGDNSLGVVVNLDLLEDERVADDVMEGLGEEFRVVDKELGETAEGSNAKLTKKSKRKDRRLSPIYQGVYIPDPRFNAFVDGVMVNMIAEMRRRRMDPLYFRVLDKGRVEHVPTHRRVRRAEGRAARQAPKEAIGGGVIRGLSRIRRFGNSEVQVAGNSTLVRSHYIMGPLDLELVFDTPKGSKTITTTLTALAGHGLVAVSSNASTALDFLVDRPADYEIKLQGAKNRRYRRLSKKAVLKLAKPGGRLENRLLRMFERGITKPLPDVAQDGVKKGLWPDNEKKPKNGSSSAVPKNENGSADPKNEAGSANPKNETGSADLTDAKNPAETINTDAEAINTDGAGLFDLRIGNVNGP